MRFLVLVHSPLSNLSVSAIGYQETRLLGHAVHIQENTSARVVSQAPTSESSLDTSQVLAQQTSQFRRTRYSDLTLKSYRDVFVGCGVATPMQLIFRQLLNVNANVLTLTSSVQAHWLNH